MKRDAAVICNHPPAAPHSTAVARRSTEAESKEKHGVRDHARVDLNPMPESTLSSSQGLWIWTQLLLSHTLAEYTVSKSKYKGAGRVPERRDRPDRIDNGHLSTGSWRDSGSHLNGPARAARASHYKWWSPSPPSSPSAMLGKTPLKTNPLPFGLYGEALASLCFTQGVTKRSRLFWLTNSALVYEPKCEVRGFQGLSCAHGAQINFGDLTPFLAYGFTPLERNHPFILH